MASITAASAARPWLSRLPPGLFGIALGLLGLAGAWLRMQPLIGEAARVIFSALLAAGTAVLVVVFVLWIGKVLRHFDVVRRESVHPVHGPLLALLTRWRWWTDVPFSVGFWSFSFPVAALAAAIVEAVRRGGWPTWVAWSAVTVASAVIGFLAVRTVLLLARGRLLPPS